MSSEQTLLQLLQSRTIVDCDTMDVEVAKRFGPFVDCTSNQAIAYAEIQKPQHTECVRESLEVASTMNLGSASYAQLAVQAAMVKLQLEISHHVTGFVHVQTNPYNSYDTQKTIEDAQRIFELFKMLAPDFDVSRVCIKIPSTWEGLQACKFLQSKGIATLATTLFTMEQVKLAGDVGCHYIAPYVNELRVHFDAGFIDTKTQDAIKMCAMAQAYYITHRLPTKVLPASLTTTDEIMKLAGVAHITISPALLQQLVTTPVSPHNATMDFTSKTFLYGKPGIAHAPYLEDESRYRLDFTMSGEGEGERKLGQAVRIFCEMQRKMENFMMSRK